MDALIKIQQELKAPKGQYNSFGKYKYRSAEDILEAVKPLLGKYNAQLTLSDEIIAVGDRVYVKAVATFTDGTAAEMVSAFAREPDDKKGMDASQITGTASSYARKYALNGLFLIDDTKDADTDEYAKQTGKGTKTAGPQQGIGTAVIESIDKLIKDTNTNRGQLLAYYNVQRLEDMTGDMAKHCIQTLRGKLNG